MHDIVAAVIFESTADVRNGDVGVALDVSHDGDLILHPVEAHVWKN